MAWRFFKDAYLKRDAGAVLNFDADYTFMGWFLALETGFSQSIFVVGNSDLELFGTDDDSHLILAGTTDSGGTSQSIVSEETIQIGSWYHLTMRRSGDVVAGFLNGLQPRLSGGVGAFQFTMAYGTRTAANTMYIANTILAATWRGYGAHFKAWQAALTRNEIQLEMQRITPRRSDGLFFCLQDNTGINLDGSEGVPDSIDTPYIPARANAARHDFLISGAARPVADQPPGIVDIPRRAYSFSGGDRFGNGRTVVLNNDNTWRGVSPKSDLRGLAPTFPGRNG